MSITGFCDAPVQRSEVGMPTGRSALAAGGGCCLPRAAVLIFFILWQERAGWSIDYSTLKRSSELRDDLEARLAEARANEAAVDALKKRLADQTASVEVCLALDTCCPGHCVL